MRHLVFLPPAAAGPALFLWPRNGARPDGGAPGRLQAAGRPARAALVTEAGAAAEVEGHRIALLDGVAILARLGAAELARVPPSVAAWSLAAKLALELVARERVLPVAEPVRGGATVRWGASLARPQDHERFARLARALPAAASAVPLDAPARAPRAGRPSGPARRAPRCWAPAALLAAFLDATADALVREAARDAGRARAAEDGGRWEARWLAALLAAEPPARVLGDGFVDRALARELAEWAQAARGTAADPRPRLSLKLDAPDAAHPAAAGGTWTLGYFLEAPDDPSLVAPAGEVWAAGGRRLAELERRFGPAHETLLRGLAEAARLFAPIERSLDAAHPAAAALADDEAWLLLHDGAARLADAGFTVRLPAALTPSGQRRLRLRLRAEGETPGPSGAVATDRGLTLDALVSYRWEVALGSQALSAAEFRALTELKRPLVRWRGEWVVVDPEEVAGIRRLLAAERGGRQATVRELLAAALAGEPPREDLPVPVEVVPEGTLAAALARLRAEPPRLPPPAGLAATLRPYQERGLAWLGLMAGLGLGGCLADDMGLGKTVQAIAFLLARRAARPGDARPALVVCPTSVVGNWERELGRFAPALPVVRHHGPGRAATPEGLRAAPAHAVVVTTYALLRRDRAVLAAVDWATVLLDEAQNVKNPGAQQAAAARGLRAAHRFALTGTPVENRLAELWSILEFCVPGLLGPLGRFRRRFAVPVERYRDEAAAATLRRLVGPFVLRRVKSDPAIVADLPPKQEIAVVCSLTREQATLYQAVLAEALADLRGAEGMKRRGRILALLTALKQVCNHPAQYLGEPGPLPGRSGKLDRLVEMLEESVAAGDRALVFTQFREMGDRLVAALGRGLGVEVLFLHGGVPREARDTMVRRFQEAPDAPPVFVLSLRAGGTGLTLTAATRVFHFDRWWNPAVEDQATDRAHRIGQRRAVQVYRLLAAGTVEEKIDRLLADKRALADRVVGAGEAWITELDDGALRELVALSDDAVVAPDEAAAPRRAATARGARAAGAR